MIRRIVLAALLFILATSAANAAVVCTLSATGVAFGLFSGSQLTSVGAIVVHCVGDGNTHYTLRLTTGGSGTYTPRQMSNGANTLSYNLYQDAALSIIWGNGTGGSTIFSGDIDMMGHTDITFSLPVYGKVPAQSTPAPGNYSDVIVATMAYQGGRIATTSFFDTASVFASCTISASDLQFFSYTRVQLDAQSQITVNCTNSTAWNVGLNQGTYLGATVTTRRMTGPQPADALAYGMYQNSARTLNWGNTIGTDTESGTGTGAPQALIVYGRVPASQTPKAGGYHDTITATLTF